MSITTKAFYFFCLAISMVTGSADMRKYAGDWKILQVYDSVDSITPRELPSSVGHPIFFKLAISETSPNDTFDLGCKVGNAMRTSVKVKEEQENSASIEVGLVMSTMMMPPEDQYKFEVFLSEALPKLATMTLSSDGQELVMIGESKIILQAEHISDA